jgi:hypothetical protein
MGQVTILLPIGNIGDFKLPHNMSDTTIYYLHAHPIIIDELRELSKAYVINVTKLKAHSINSVSNDINRTLKWSVPFNLPHLKEKSILAMIHRRGYTSQSATAHWLDCDLLPFQSGLMF